MTGSAAPQPQPDDIAPRVATLFSELAGILQNCENERDSAFADCGRLPPYSPNLPLTITTLQLGDRCVAMRKTLVGLERDVRRPTQRYITMNRPPTSTIHWQVIDAARAQMASEPGGRRLLPTPPGWAERVAEMRALIQQARAASLTGTAWPSPP